MADLLGMLEKPAATKEDVMMLLSNGFKSKLQEKLTFGQKMRNELNRIEDLKQVKYDPGDRFIFREHDFYWLIKNLSQPQHSKLCGCPVPMMPIAIYKDGKCELIVRQAPEEVHDGSRNCLTIARQNVQNQEVRKFMMQQL